MVRMRREGLRVPGILGVECEPSNVDYGKKGGGGWMMMEWIDGQTTKEVLRAVKETRKRSGKKAVLKEEIQHLMARIGNIIGKMHGMGVVHGDLTTSNLMIRPITRQTSGVRNGISEEHANVGDKSDVEDESTMREILVHGEIVLVDFGLAAQSIQDEDKAVDLYVLERAFGSTHPEAEAEFREVLRAYGESYRGAKVVLKKLEDVRLRGRKKSMIG